MKMHDVEVCVLSGTILIVQEGDNGEQQIVFITPEQAELFVRWVRDAAESIRSNGSDAVSGTDR